MIKTYSEIMNEISADFLYKGLLAHGMFSTKLPPVFSTIPFFDYCKTLKTAFENKPKQYISLQIMRHKEGIREFGIPNPMAYQRQCRCIANYWDLLQKHFYCMTQNHKYKVSRIHIRRIKRSPAIFEMNYKNWRIDGSPEPDLLIGKKFLVRADITKFFPSIYTHSLCWALVGKETSKEKRKENEWFNAIDHSTQQTKDGETHGLLIGPHSSNLLSEIILTCVDERLVNKGWEFIRHVDDYTCYVPTYEKGEAFISDLSSELNYFQLQINDKKTEITEFPLSSTTQWTNEINTFTPVINNNYINYKVLRQYMDFSIELFNNNEKNSAILNYMIKTLANKKVSDNAMEYYVKTILHLASINTYLIFMLEDHIFSRFQTDKTIVSSFSENLLFESVKTNNFEGIYYAIYFAIKWDFSLTYFTADIAIATKNCLVLLFSIKYFEKISDRKAVKMIKDYAKTIKDTKFDANWLFLYEILPQSELSGDWKPMKKKGISFITI